jgi:hypothetical protein
MLAAVQLNEYFLFEYIKTKLVAFYITEKSCFTAVLLVLTKILHTAWHIIASGKTMTCTDQ